MRYVRQMGIPKDAALDALSGYEETEAALRLVEKKLRTMKASPPDVVRRRLAGCLQRRGYSSDTIRKALMDVKNFREEK